MTDNTTKTTLTNRLQALTQSFGQTNEVLDEILTQAMIGNTAMSISQQPSQAMIRLGFKITKSLDDHWIIDWSKPKQSESEYMSDKSAEVMCRLAEYYQVIRDFFEEVERKAGEAASFGLREYHTSIPENIDRKELQDYISRVYPYDDISIEKDSIAVRWSM